MHTESEKQLVSLLLPFLMFCNLALLGHDQKDPSAAGPAADALTSYQAYY